MKKINIVRIGLVAMIVSGLFVVKLGDESTGIMMVVLGIICLLASLPNVDE